MLELALHVLDIAENSTRAGAKTVTLKINEEEAENRLSLEVIDDGVGMDAEALSKALDPFYTTKKVRRVGLGLPMLSQAAERTGGRLILDSQPGKGTRLEATFGLRHIDRQPLGDIAGVLVSLIVGNPDVRFIYAHERDSHLFTLDTEKIRDELEGAPINHPEVLKYIREYVRQGLQEMNSEA